MTRLSELCLVTLQIAMLYLVSRELAATRKTPWSRLEWRRYCRTLPVT